MYKLSIKSFSNPNPLIVTLNRENKLLEFVDAVLNRVLVALDVTLRGQIIFSVYRNIHIIMAHACKYLRYDSDAHCSEVGYP